jgi:16S rRNA (cytosine967-C5)-methyltransferase
MARARDAALAVLTRVEEGRAYAAAALESELRAFEEPREAAFAFELVLGVLRNRLFLDELLEKASKTGLEKIDPAVRRILRLAVYQIAFLDKVPSRAAVSQAVEQVRRSRAPGLSGLVNALLRRISRMGPKALSLDSEDNQGSVRDSAVRLSIPEWLLERLVAAYGRERAFAMARSFNRPSRRTLRLNLKRASRDDIKEGTTGLWTPWSVDTHDRSQGAGLVESGAAAYQDEGAQLVALAVEPGAGDRILDACSGRGGKTAALAAMVDGTAEILAVDRSAGKLERLVFELNRQGYQVNTLRADLTQEARTIEGEFSKVLLDAPCSGTGTIGRRPEIRWRITPESVKSLVEVQSRLLSIAANLVAPGGRLVYAVCSVLKEEGVEHSAPFSKRHPSFHLVATPPALWPDQVPWSNGMVLIDPATGHTDGYQILVFQRE